MERTIRPNLTFFLTGFILWALGSFMIVILCFEPIVSLDEIGQNKELALEISNAWGAIMLKTAILWSLAGGILGLIISRFFITRPDYEHFMRTPLFLEIVGMPRFFGPKTISEISAGFRGCILGTIVGVCGVIFVLPMLQSELVVAKELGIRIIFGAIQTLIVTVPILPISLWIISKRLKRMGY